MKFRIVLASINESLHFSVQNIKANLLRTLLSLLGVSIGVFCIIGILTLVDSIHLSIESSFSKMGDRTIFIQKWPWIFTNDYPFWKYINRPELKFREMEQLEKRFPQAEAIAYATWIRDKKITFENNSAESITMLGLSANYDKARDLNFLLGRYFSESESEKGDAVILLGHDLAGNLFGSQEGAMNKMVNLMGRHLRVIGVMKKEGGGLSMMGQVDMQCMVPINFLRQFGSFESAETNPSIFIKLPAHADQARFEDDLRGVMRSVRKLSPRQDDDFAFNKLTMFSNILAKIFGQINIYGWIIAGFSILVGGFGIANIMFVSVQERTHIIGIQKALGAQNYFILIQFLGEAIILCVMGGMIGLLLVWGLVSLVNSFLPFQFILTFENIMVAIGLSSLIGVLAGYIPSMKAANLDPITAIRYKM